MDENTLRQLKQLPGLSFPNSTEFRQTCSIQEFSISMPIMKYIWTNPTYPIAYQKLIQSCKLFFIKNSMIVLTNLCYYQNKWTYCAWGTIETKTIDLNKIKEKIWLSNELTIYVNKAMPNITNNSRSMVQFLISKIYKYDVSQLLLNDVILFDELKYLSKGVKECNLGFSGRQYDNGDIILLAEVIKLFSNASKLSLILHALPSLPTYDAFIDACRPIKEVYLHNTPNDFNVPQFYEHLKSSKSHTMFNIFSCNNAILLGAVVTEILQTESFDFVPPVIQHLRLVNPQKMIELQAKEAAKYWISQ